MSSWPRWRRDGQPGALAQYVLPGEVTARQPGEVTARLPGLPGPGDGDALGRVRGVYEAFAAAGIRYAHELPSDDPDWQVIRPPDHVLATPKHATCLDAAVTFAGACLAAGLHPLVVIADPRAGGEAAHAVVVVWMSGGWAGRPDLAYPRERGWVLVGADDEALQHRGVRPFVDGPGEFLAVDPTCATLRAGQRPASFEDAVAEGARIVRGEGWDWRVGVDVGIGFNPHECFRPAARPAGEPLDSPYEDPARLDERSLRLLRAEYGVVPFRGRDELDVLLDWATAPGRDGRLRLAVVTGVGGSGKTRLVAELAHRLAVQGWHTGFVPRSPDPGLADWLAGTASPLLVAIDYAEARWAEAAQLITALRRRPGWPTCVVLTAREAGNWYEQLDGALTESRVEPTTEPVHLAPSHVRPDRVYQRAFEAFSRRFGAPRPAPALPRLPDGGTTLDVVLLAWLAALGVSVEDLPESRSELYDEVLKHERRYWTKAYRTRSAEAPTTRLLDHAAACVTLLNPEPDRAGETLGAVKGLTRWREYLAETLTECLASRDDRLAVKPDVIGDHLAIKVFGTDGQLLVRCLQHGNETERLAGLVNLTRAADEQPEVAARLATAALDSVDGLWRPALAVAEAMGGPCVPGLAALAERDRTPLPLVELAEQIPSGHATLRPIALAAAERLVANHRVAGDGEPAELARLLNNLSVRLSEVGRRHEALEAITEAVTLYRRLAQANPGAFLPDLAMSLNNQAARLSDVGRRHEALEAITEAVTLRRELAEANPDAFLPDLATSLNNQANMLSEVGRRAEALARYEEAAAAFAGRPGHHAELLASRAAWRAGRGDLVGALADLRVLAAAQPADPDQLAPLGRARRSARALAAQLPLDLAGSLPAWATAPIPDAATALVNAWAPVAGTRAEAELLAGHAPDLADPATAGAVPILADLHPGDAFLARCLAVLDAVAAHGLEATLAALAAANDQAVTVREWIATPTWSASRDMLEARQEVLLSPDVEALLEEQADGDATAAQHLAIVRLCRQLPIADVYDLLTDVTDAAEQANAALARGDGQRLRLVLLASPSLAQSPFHGPATLAALALLAGQPDDAVEWAKEAAAQGSPTQRRAFAGRLERLAAARPEHADATTRLVAALHA